jgi:hypothetical protein
MLVVAGPDALWLLDRHPTETTTWSLPLQPDTMITQVAGAYLDDTPMVVVHGRFKIAK